jgi:hypothetical protein
MIWLLAILGYAIALALVLLLVGGVRRGDARHREALQRRHEAERYEAPPRSRRLGPRRQPQRVAGH